MIDPQLFVKIYKQKLMKTNGRMEVYMYLRIPFIKFNVIEKR